MLRSCPVSHEKVESEAAKQGSGGYSYAFYTEIYRSVKSDNSYLEQIRTLGEQF